MAHRTLDRWRWRLQRGVEPLGVPGVVGIALLVATLWVVAVDMPSARQALQHELARTAAASTQGDGSTTLANAGSAAATLTLPPAAHARRLPGDVLATLRSAGVNVVEVSTPELGARPPAAERAPRHIDLSVTAHGSYASIKSGLDALLQQHPTLALTYLGLANESTRSGGRTSPLQAQIRVRYYFAPTT